jgi:hypothetical protein
LGVLRLGVGLAAGVLEAKGDACFGQQPGEEVFVGLAVLEAVGEGWVLFGEVEPVGEGFGEGGVVGQVFVEDGFKDVGHAHVLEDAAGVVVAQEGERRSPVVERGNMGQ